MSYGIAEVIAASDGLLDKPAIYYAIGRGWFRPKRVKKAKIDRFAFSDKDLRLARMAAGYLNMGLKTQAAFRLAMEDTAHEEIAGLDAFARKGKVLRDIVAEAVGEETVSERGLDGVLCSPSSAEDEELNKALGEGFPGNLELLGTASNLFQVSRAMLDIVREREANAVFPVKPESSLLVGAILAVAHFMRVDLRLFAPPERSDATDAHERTPDDSALRVALVDSVLDSAETLLSAKEHVQKSGAAVTGVTALLDCLNPSDRGRIEAAGCCVMSIHDEERLWSAIARELWESKS
jgi:hypothetical protein